MRFNRIKYELVIMLAAATMSAAAIFVLTPRKTKNFGEAQLILPPKHVELFALGYRDTLADTFWLRAIQDFDQCGHSLTAEKKCDDSWVYHMLDAITDLSPKFRIAYVDGATNLEIIVKDIQGAGKIYRKGLTEFPHYWTLEYRAAYHYMFEDKKNQEAAQLLVDAQKDGGPPWLSLLAAKLLKKEGQDEFAERIILDALDSAPDGPIHDRLEARLKEIRGY